MDGKWAESYADSKGWDVALSENVLPLHERIRLLYERLQNAPPCRTADEALGLICVVLEAVEDEWSGVPRDPNPTKEFEGRMYPPQGDSITLTGDGGKRVRTKGHQIFLEANGTITFKRLSNHTVEFVKQGAE